MESTMKCSEGQTDEKQLEFLDKLNGLDFGPLAYKLMNPEDRRGLSFEQAVDAIKKYKGFLFLYYANQGTPVSPSRYIDYVWHAHILDTELYVTQTVALFGHYLHHFPFFGKRDTTDEKNLLAAAEFTKSQAFNNFGWDEDDWCGTPKPKGHAPGTNATSLIDVLFPGGADILEMNPHIGTLQAGSFKQPLGDLRLQRAIIYLPIWVISCMPADLRLVDEVIVIKQIERERLVEISRSLVENRLAPEGFSRELVNLQIRN